MDCCSRKISLFPSGFEAVGVLEQDCCYITDKFEAISLVTKTPWEALLM